MAHDIAGIPHRIDTEVVTYDANQWTETQVQAGEAIPSHTETQTTWYDADGATVTDPARIAELEAQIKEH